MVFVIIVTYNAKDVIRWCLESLAEQTYKDIHVLIVDNASVDGTLGIVREFQGVSLIKNRNNLGYCKANNQGLTLALENNSSVRPEFILFLNQDTILRSDTVEQLVRAANNNPRVAMFGPKILRYSFNHETDDRGYPVQTSIIDSAGIYLLSSFQFVSRGEGIQDSGQFSEGEVWGFTGTCNLMRSSTWELVKTRTREYLDEDLFMYKDDIDLAFRLHALNQVIWFAPNAVVYHNRTERGALGDLTFWNFFNNLRVARRKKNSFTTFYGYRNQLLVLYKHLTLGQVMRHLFPLAWFEFRKFVYFFLTQPGMLFRAWRDFFRLSAKMSAKKKMMKEIIGDK